MPKQSSFSYVFLVEGLLRNNLKDDKIVSIDSLAPLNLNLSGFAGVNNRTTGSVHQTLEIPTESGAPCSLFEGTAGDGVDLTTIIKIYKDRVL